MMIFSFKKSFFSGVACLLMLQPSFVQLNAFSSEDASFFQETSNLSDEKKNEVFVDEDSSENDPAIPGDSVFLDDSDGDFSFDVKLIALPALPQDATIGTIFEDANLALHIADLLGREIIDFVSQDELNTISELSYNGAFKSDDEKIVSLEGVQYLLELKVIFLPSNRINTIPTLSLTSVETINLWNNQLQNVDAFVNLTTVGVNLLIEDNQLQDVDGLANLTTVGGSLSFLNNQLQNVDGLVKLTMISESLTLSNNQLQNVGGLANLITVGESLFLNNNQLQSVDGLANLTTVGLYLDVTNNQLQNVDGLANLTIVGNSLYFSANQLANLEPLKHLSVPIFANEQNISTNRVWEEGAFSFENPLVDRYGNKVAPTSIVGGSYDDITNTITFTAYETATDYSFSWDDANNFTGTYTFDVFDSVVIRVNNLDIEIRPDTVIDPIETFESATVVRNGNEITYKTYENFAAEGGTLSSDVPDILIDANFNVDFEFAKVEKQAIIRLYVPFTIDYDLDGGEFVEDVDLTISYNRLDNDISLPTDRDIIKQGYAFGGWKNSATSEIISNIPAGSTGDLMLEATWSDSTYTVLFDANGGTGEMNNQEFFYPEMKPLSPNSFSRVGYTFIGWSTLPDLDGSFYKDEQVISKLSSHADGTVSLYAQWMVGVNPPVEDSNLFIGASNTSISFTTSKAFDEEVAISLTDAYAYALHNDTDRSLDFIDLDSFITVNAIHLQNIQSASEKGDYPLTLSVTNEAERASITVIVHVIESDHVVENSQYILTGSDIVINELEAKKFTDGEFLNKANVKAYDKLTEDFVETVILKSTLRSTPGEYKIVVGIGNQGVRGIARNNADLQLTLNVTVVKGTTLVATTLPSTGENTSMILFLGSMILISSLSILKVRKRQEQDI